MQVDLIHLPLREPIHLDDAKAFLKWEDSLQEDTLLRLIRAARYHVERRTRRSLVQRTLRLRLRAGEVVTPIRLPYPPFLALDTFTLYDEDNAATVVSSSDYQIAGADPARLVEDGTTGWSGGGREYDAAVIDYRAGYESPVTSVDTSGDALTAPSHPLANGDRVQLRVSGGRLPSPLVEHADYFVVGATTDTVQLSLTSGGAAVDLADAGHGNLFVGVRLIPENLLDAVRVHVANAFYNRVSVHVGRSIGEVANVSPDALMAEYLHDRY